MKRLVCVLLVLLTVLAGCATSGGGTQPADAPAPSAEISASDPAPEPEPAAEPGPTIQERVDKVYGAFTPVVKSGKGDGVVSIPEEAIGAMITAEHSGSSNFAIEALDADNAEVELIVNAIGKYRGVTWMLYEQTTRLRISADGSWKITVAPLSSAPVLGKQARGEGDAVFVYETESADWTFTHTGQSNFVVDRILPGNEELLVNEIGAYTGTVPVTAAAGIMMIGADGAWTFASE